MIKDKISNHIYKPISGEWGDDCDGVNCRNVLRTTNFTHLGNVKYDEVVRRTIDEVVFQKKRLYKNDIIIEKSGGSDTIAVGRVVFFDLDDDNYTCNNFTSILRCKKTINPKYLHYCLYNNHKLGLTAYYQNKTTGIRNLQLTRYMDTEISLFPLPQQEKIVSVLDTASALVEKQKALLEKYDLFLKSKFIEMFGDPVKNPMGWEEVNIGQIAQVQTGKTPSRKNMDYWDNGTENWAKTTEANHSVIYETEEKITHKAVKENHLIIFPVNTILIAMYGQGKTRGKVVRLGTPSTTNQAFGAILPSEKYNVFFLLALLDLLYQDIRDLGRGGNQENLNLDIVRKIEIILPPIDIQTQFAQIVEQTESLKQKEQQKLEKLQTLYDALMKRAFNGEII